MWGSASFSVSIAADVKFFVFVSIASVAFGFTFVYVGSYYCGHYRFFSTFRGLLVDLCFMGNTIRRYLHGGPLAGRELVDFEMVGRG